MTQTKDSVPPAAAPAVEAATAPAPAPPSSSNAPASDEATHEDKDEAAAAWAETSTAEPAAPTAADEADEADPAAQATAALTAAYDNVASAFAIAQAEWATQYRGMTTELSGLGADLSREAGTMGRELAKEYEGVRGALGATAGKVQSDVAAQVAGVRGEVLAGWRLLSSSLFGARAGAGAGGTETPTEDFCGVGVFDTEGVSHVPTTVVAGTPLPPQRATAPAPATAPRAPPAVADGEFDGGVGFFDTEGSATPVPAAAPPSYDEVVRAA
ncbi:uncharacterized protein LOC62_02G002888 [Vanrija pseudolonga]|uniref:Uncharacterized protein n=1 Tax=Vanrija pseudolonga TaxID=143232 RepID=A0AAF1BK99_9TREE|nr:hypothetical protein LOC62_02G002888 [Vanrija pseudolonga]